MRKIYLSLMMFLFVGQTFAGGILTNTNQSSMFTRLQARDATLGIDAVYYNPAGLNFLSNNGFFLSINNQTLGQTRGISSDYQFLNNGEYTGNVSAPFFPGLYAAYKMDRWAFSFGFNPIGGGGGGVYEDGLPSFEYAISDLVPALASQGAQGYRADAYFEGSSAFFGYQANVSFKINDMLSVALGGRLVTAKEGYNGYLNSVELNMGGTWTPASSIMYNVASLAGTGGDDVQPLIDAGVGALTPAEALAGGIITQEQHDGIVGGLTLIGANPAGLTIEQAQAAYYGAEAQYNAAGSVLEDQSADMEKTATGFTPIVSVNFKPNDMLNFSFKYEHKTTLEFENNTTEDFTLGFMPDGTPVTMFPDGVKSRLDLPSQISVGAAYRPMEKLLLSGAFHSFLDKNADWEGREETLDGNGWELGLGAEYGINEMLLVSAGWLKTSTGATEAYQSDLSYSLPTNTFGGGVAINFNPKIQLNLAGSYTWYEEGERTFSHNFAGSGVMTPIMETYNKETWIVSLGLNFNFGAEK